MSDPIDHHFIPSSHLRLFTQDEDRKSTLWVTDLHSYSQKTKHPKAVGYVKHFHTLEPGAYDDDPYIYERTFSQLESEALPVLKKLTQEEKLPNRTTQFTDFELLINYIALLAVRTPVTRDNIDGAISEVKDIWMEFFINYASQAITKNASLSNIGDSIKMELTPSAKMHLMLNQCDALLKPLAERHWTLYSCKNFVANHPVSGGFVCSDNPVTVGSSKYPLDFYGYGLLRKDVEVYVPISKSAFLVGRYSGNDVTESVTAKSIAAANRQTIMYADRYLYHAIKNFTILDVEGNIQDAATHLHLRKRHNNKT